MKRFFINIPVLLLCLFCVSSCSPEKVSLAGGHSVEVPGNWTVSDTGTEPKELHKEHQLFAAETHFDGGACTIEIKYSLSRYFEEYGGTFNPKDLKGCIQIAESFKQMFRGIRELQVSELSNDTFNGCSTKFTFVSYIDRLFLSIMFNNFYEKDTSLFNKFNDIPVSVTYTISSNVGSYDPTIRQSDDMTSCQRDMLIMVKSMKLRDKPLFDKVSISDPVTIE